MRISTSLEVDDVGTAGNVVLPEISPHATRNQRCCGAPAHVASSIAARFRTPRTTAVNRTPAQRFAILLVMAFHLFAWTGDVLGVHPCPHHSGLDAAAMAHAQPGAAHHGHDKAPAGHDGHDACTCVSACPSITPALLPRTATAFSATVAVHHAAAPAAGPSLLSRSRPYLLPYGQAPPA